MEVIYYAQFVLLIGNNAVELFDYYSVQEMHGVSKIECINRIAEGGTYIDGFANYDPKDTLLNTDPLPFVFINRSALHGDYRDVTLINHEMIHMSLLIHSWDVDNHEEDVVTWAEEYTNAIYARHFKKINEPEPVGGGTEFPKN
jgi:hypothetical protein